MSRFTSVAVTTVLAVAGLLSAGAGVGAAALAPQPAAGASPGIAAVSPGPGQTVGVAMPVTVTFDRPVADRLAAQRSVRVSAPATMTGSYSWLDDRAVQFTPAGYWPAHSTIALSVGGAGIKTTFETGAEVLGVADIDAHTFTVSVDGETLRQMPASMGKPRHTTPIGSFTALEKQKTVVMDSRTIGIPLSDPEGYKLTVSDAVRVTWGGVYVHSAPWSVAQQGNSNVSHGCVNLSPENAAWYFDTVNIGDPIVVQA